MGADMKIVARKGESRPLYRYSIRIRFHGSKEAIHHIIRADDRDDAKSRLRRAYPKKPFDIIEIHRQEIPIE